MSWQGIIGNALSIAFFVGSMVLYFRSPPSRKESRVAFWIVTPIAAAAVVAIVMITGHTMYVGADELLRYRWR